MEFTHKCGNLLIKQVNRVTLDMAAKDPLF